MKIVTTHSDTIDPALYAKAVSFVQGIAADNPNSPAIVNMGLDSKSGLLWNISSKSRWTEEKGEIAFLLNETDDIVGVSCVERTSQSMLAIGGIRTWVLKPYRGKNVISNMMLNSNLDWAVSKEMAGMLLTFNDYNRWIYDGIRRKVNGKAAGMANIWSDWWNDCLVLDRPIKVRNVNQWCVVKPTGMQEVSVLNSIMEGLDAIAE
jgi:hypothetical protein